MELISDNHSQIICGHIIHRINWLLIMDSTFASRCFFLQNCWWQHIAQPRPPPPPPNRISWISTVPANSRSRTIKLSVISIKSWASQNVIATLTHIYESLPAAGQAVGCSGTFMQFLNQVFEIFSSTRERFPAVYWRGHARQPSGQEKGGKNFAKEWSLSLTTQCIDLVVADSLFIQILPASDWQCTTNVIKTIVNWS